jgi:hypothetical protein
MRSRPARRTAVWRRPGSIVDGSDSPAATAMARWRTPKRRWDSLVRPASRSISSRHSRSTRASLEPAPRRAEASVAELLDALTAGQPFWGAWSLPDLLEGVAHEERLAQLRAVLDAATPRTRWYDAATAAIRGEFARAADIYAEMGSQPDEAVARLRAAAHVGAAGDLAQAREQLVRARAFLRRVGAHAYLRNAETLALTPRGRPGLHH